MDIVLAGLAAVAASAFTLDLTLNLRRRFRPHVAAYATGIAMFAIATWALVVGLAAGWSDPVYKTFYLFGVILNIPYLALGSMILVAGPRLARAYLAMLVPFTFAAVMLTLPAAIAGTYPADAVPVGREIFEDRYVPVLGALGGAVGATLLVVLALVSVARFWRSNRRIVAGNLLIVAGTMAAASQGTALAVAGRTGGFALALAMAVTLIWAGHRVAVGARRGDRASAGSAAGGPVAGADGP